MFRDNVVYVYKDELFEFISRCVGCEIARINNVKDLSLYEDKTWLFHGYQNGQKVYYSCFRQQFRPAGRDGWLFPGEAPLCVNASDYSKAIYEAGEKISALLSGQQDILFDLIARHPNIFAKYLINRPEKESRLPSILYKYVPADSQYVDSAVEGKLCFAKPNDFNDPFDCDYILPSGQNIKDDFRVLSLSANPKDILMWSYYAKDHKGLCIGHNTAAIISVSLPRVYSGIVIYGPIAYKSVRPKPKYVGITAGMPSSVIHILNVIDCCFAKYAGWKAEKEYRFLTFKKGFFSTGPGGVCLIDNSPIPCYYKGVNSTYIYGGSKSTPIPIELKKDVDKYSLI